MYLFRSMRYNVVSPFLLTSEALSKYLYGLSGKIEIVGKKQNTGQFILKHILLNMCRGIITKR